MADQRISALLSGAPAQNADAFVIARGSQNFKLTLADLSAAIGAPATPTLAQVLAAGADAGGAVITGLGAPVAETDAAQRGTVVDYVFNSLLSTVTAYTFVVADIGRVVNPTSASATTLTIPPGSAVAGGWPIVVGRPSILVRAGGTGLVTIAAGAGVAIHSRGSLVSLAGQWAWATLVNTSGDNWDLFGDLA